jgi:hypothetical protein
MFIAQGPFEAPNCIPATYKHFRVKAFFFFQEKFFLY